MCKLLRWLVFEEILRVRLVPSFKYLITLRRNNCSIHTIERQPFQHCTGDVYGQSLKIEPSIIPKGDS